MGAHSHDASPNLVDYEKVTDSHYDFLGSFLGSKEKAKDAIFYSYTRSINGFAANLEEEEAQQISIFLSKRKKLHTTRSWGFLGLERDGRVPKDSLMNQGKYGEGVIIANINTGVWPESESFNDTGLGPAPPRWKGTCETNTSAPVKCNRDTHELARKRDKILSIFSQMLWQYTVMSIPSSRRPRSHPMHKLTNPHLQQRMEASQVHPPIGGYGGTENQQHNQLISVC